MSEGGARFVGLGWSLFAGRKDSGGAVDGAARPTTWF